MKIRNLVGAMVALVGITFAGAALGDGGDILGVWPCDKYGTALDAPISSPVEPWNEKTACTDGKAYFKVRFLNRNYASSPHPWAYVKVMPGVVRDLAVGVLVSGVMKEAYCEGLAQTQGDRYTDFIFSYLVEPGDLALPMMLSNENGKPFGGDDAVPLKLYWTGNYSIQDAVTGETANWWWSSESSPLLPERNADYDLTQAGIFLKTFDFDRQSDEKTGAWRRVPEKSRKFNALPTTPTITVPWTTATNSTSTMSIFLWSENEDAFTLTNGFDVIKLKRGEVESGVTRTIAELKIQPGKESYKFNLWGVESGRKANIVMAATDHYVFNDAGAYMTNFLTRAVVVDVAEPPSVTLAVADNPVTATKDWEHKLTEISVEFSEGYGEDVEIEIVPEFTGAKGTHEWYDYLRFAASPNEDVTLQGEEEYTNFPRVVILKNELKPSKLNGHPLAEGGKVYVYGLYGDAFSNGGSGKFTVKPVTTNEHAAAGSAAGGIDGWGEKSALAMKAADPELSSPVSVLSANIGKPRDFEINVADVYFGVKGAEGYRLYTQNCNEGVDPEAGKWTELEKDVRWRVDANGVLTNGVGKLPSLKYSSAKTYVTWFYVQGPNGQTSGMTRDDALAVTVKVSPAPEVSARISTDDETWVTNGKFKENTQLYVNFDLSVPRESGDDKPIYAFLAPKGDAAACVSGDALTNTENAVGVEIRAGETTSDYSQMFTVVDGTRISGTKLTFDIVLCESETYDPAKVIDDYQSRGLTFQALNVIPKLTKVTLDRSYTVTEDGGTPTTKAGVEAKVPLGVEKEFVLTVDEPGTVDKTIDEEGKKFKIDWGVVEANGRTDGGTLYGNPKNAKIAYTFTGDGRADFTVTVEDKDMADDPNVDETEEFTFYVNVTAKASVTITTPETVGEDMSGYSQAPIDVALSDFGNHAITTKVTVIHNETTEKDRKKLGFIRIGGAINNDPLVDADGNEYYLVRLSGGKARLFVDEADGTDLSNRKGFTLKAAIVDSGTDPVTGKAWSECYEPSETIMYVANVEPQLVDCSLGATILEGNTNAVKVGIGEVISVDYRVDDVMTDVTNGIKVQWWDTDNKNAAVTNVYDSTNTYYFTTKFKNSGPKTIRVTLTDKDSKPTYVGEWNFLVESTKTLITVANGPSAGVGNSTLSQRYSGAKGAGEGHVWSDASFAFADTFQINWNCNPSTMSANVFGWGYKTNAVDNGTLDSETIYQHDIPLSPKGNNTTESGKSALDAYYEYTGAVDSFLYGWIYHTMGEGGQGGGSSGLTSTLQGISPERTLRGAASASAPLPNSAGGDKAGATATVTYPTVYMEAVFAREYLPSDNMGDINADGIPDLYLLVSDYEFGIIDPKTGELTGDDLRDLNFTEGEDPEPYCLDYLPTTETEVYSHLIPGLPESWAGEAGTGKPFIPRLKIRGFDETDPQSIAKRGGISASALNDAPTKWAGVAGVKPDQIYTNPREDEFSTLNYVEWLAWQEFATAQFGADAVTNKAYFTQWSPERPTNPTRKDTDGDGLTDGYEYYFWYMAHVGWVERDAAGNEIHRYLTGRAYNPRNPGEGDLIDSTTIENAFDPQNPTSYKLRDTDNDGLPDELEFLIGTNPIDFDTDGDGLPDGWEIMIGGTDPVLAGSSADALADGERNYDGDAMAISSYALEKTQKPVSFDIEHAKFTTFAVIKDDGDTDGVQWYAVRGAPEDVLLTTATNGAAGWSFKLDVKGDDRDYVWYGEKLPVTADGKRLAASLEKGRGASGVYISTEPVEVVTNGIVQVEDPENPGEMIDQDVLITNKLAGALYPVRLAAGTPIKSVLEKPVDIEVVSLASNIEAKVAFACWIYGKGPQNARYGEVAKTAADYGCLALARPLAAAKGAQVVALPDDTRDVAFLHYLVYQEFGFDPRTAWCAKDPVHPRWGKTTSEGQASEGVTVLKQGGFAGAPARTREYRTYDEFLVYSFFLNNVGENLMTGWTTASDEAPYLAQVWMAFCTNPRGPNEPAWVNDEHYTGWTAMSLNGTNGADTDGDGVPDGWELYIMAGPKNKNGSYVFAPPYAGFAGSLSGAGYPLEKSYFSPFMKFAKEQQTNNQIYLGGQPNDDGLNEYREFEGTDSTGWYANVQDGNTTPFSTTVVHDGEWTWFNKFFPTDPWNVDTDGDGLSDAAEKAAFAYGTPADDGKLWSIPGGGLNPCSVDTDLDGLPDGWENQFKGKTVYADDAEPKPFRAKDATGAEVGNPLEGLTDGMDGTVPDAYNVVNGDSSAGSSGSTTWTVFESDGRRWSGHVDRDYDHDGLENWQEYLVGTMRCWRYDDPFSPWTAFDESVYFDAFGNFDAVRSAEILGIGGDSDEEKAAAFWYETLVNSQGSFYNPHFITGSSPVAQYFSRVTNAWDTAYLDAELSGGKADGAYYYFKDRVGGNLIKDTWSKILPLPGGSRSAPGKYISCSPIDSDTDCDGMDDYYELFHGMNPLLGASGKKAGSGDACDIVYDAWCNTSALEAYGSGDTKNYWQRNPWKKPRGTNGMDFEVFPYLNGLWEADPDGDNDRNGVEFLSTREKDIGSHTDPTPLWMTDSSYSNSLTRLHYRIPTRANPVVPFGEGFTYNDVEYKFSQFDGWGPCGLVMGYMPFNLDSYWSVTAEDEPNWMFSFEENEGFDTDHDALGDREERDGLYRAATDPLDADSPRRRQAMYFQGPSKPSALQTMPEVCEEYPVATKAWPTDPSFLNFTVECWAKPEDPARDQTVVERAVWTDPSNLGDQEYLRKNFQIALRGGKWMAKYDSGTLTNDEVKAFSRDAAEMKWTHLAATFDGSEFRLYVDGVCQNDDTCGVKTIPENGVSAYAFVKSAAEGATKRPGDYAWDVKYECKAILVGASFKGSSEGGKPEALDVTSALGWNYYRDFFQGYVDEIRIWDGARTSDEIAGIKGDMLKRYSAADAKANRDAFYGQWANDEDRYAKATTVRVVPELRYHFHFDSVPGAADADSVMKAPTGFQNAGGKPVLSRPVGYAIDWFAKIVDAYGTVYGPDRDWVQWIPNTVAHLPRFDGTTLDSFYWSKDYSGANPDSNAFENSAEPVSRWTQMKYNGADSSSRYKSPSMRHHLVYELDRAASNETSTVSLYQFTGRHLNQMGDDLLPLGGAFVKYSPDLWDGTENGPSTQWEHTGVDSSANMLPDWYEEYVRRTYGLEGGIEPDTDVFAYGRTMKVRELYLIDLARGIVRTADGMAGEFDPQREQVADADKDSIPDWWEEVYRIHTADTDLKAGHAWDDVDNDGLANISEYAVCTGAVLSADQTINPLVRVSDGFTIDYFRKLADGRYLGEVKGIADHDMMEDAWEDLYDVTRANRWIWDALDDRDRDGWSNYAECRAGTDPTRVSSLIFEGIEKIDFPIPTVELTLNRPAKAAGSNDTVIVEAWKGSDTTGEPDAVWTVGSGYSGAKSRFLGRNTGRTLTFNCGPGSVVPGSFKLSFKDPTADSIEWNTNKTEIVQALKVNEGENVWANSVLDMQRSDGGTIGDVVWRGDGDTFIGTIDYQTGLVTVDLSKVAGWDWNTWSDDTHCIRTYIDKSYMRADWTSKMLTRSVDTTLYLSEPDKGALREGPNTFVARSEDGSLAGVARNVNVGWSEVKDLVIDLTADSAVFPRFEAGVTDGEPATVKIVRKSINGVPAEKIVMRKRDVEGRHLFTEADFVRDGAFDLDWATLAPAATNAGVLAKAFSEVEYEVTVDGKTLDTFTKTFESVRTKPVAFSPTADQDNLLLSVSPTFRWTGPAGYTAFRLQVATDEDFADVVYDSGARFLTALRDGTYEFASDCYLNEHLADGQTCFWRVAMLNAKFTDAADGWSQFASFTVAADSTRLNTGYGKAAVDVRYYGSNDCTRADVVVGLYRSADFTDAPVALQHLAAGDLALLAVTNVRGCVAFTTNNVALFDGLKVGTYYAMAFIDANANGVRDAWESWGYLNNIGTTRTDLYTPMTIDVVANRAVRGECVLFVEDTDVNEDGVPDCWQDLSGWSQVAPSVEDADLDGDGLPDDWEDLMGAGAAGFPTDDPEIDAAYAAAGDVMAYAEVDRVMVTFADGTQALVMKGVKRPTEGDLAQSCSNGTYEAVYAYGDRIGLGLPVTVSDTALRITKVEDVKVALVHAQVYDEFGYDMRTANPVAYANYIKDNPGAPVVWKEHNTKPFTALDKYLVWTYLRAIGSTDETEETAANWAQFTLKPGDPDQNRDGVADGWQLYVMFGPNGEFSASTPWTSAAAARTVTPGKEGLTWVQEYDGGYLPTDPWSIDTDRDSVTDYYAYQYHLKGSDAGKDFDGDGLSNYAEYLISEVFRYAKCDPEKKMTDGHQVDYFQKMGDLYVGEIFTDHDQIDDVWEGEYANYANRDVYDPDRDDDNDGWSNYAEFRAGTDPSKTAALGVIGANDTTTYTKNEYPIPVIEAKVVYNGRDVNLGSIVFKAWNEAKDPGLTSAPDAIWTIGNGEAADKEESGSTAPSSETGSTAEPKKKYLGRRPTGVQRYVLGGGSILRGSVSVRFLDQAYARTGISTNVTKAAMANWYVGVTDKEGALIDLRNDSKVGTVDYDTGVLTLDCAKFTGSAIGLPNPSGETEATLAADPSAADGTGAAYYDTLSLDGSYLLLAWSAVNVGLSANGTYVLGDADDVDTGAKSHGHVCEGLNTFICFADTINVNGAYDPGEPFGVVRGVDVGWQGAKFTVELTETSPIFSRIDLYTEGDDRAVTFTGQILDESDYIGKKPRPAREGLNEHVRIVPYMVTGSKLEDSPDDARRDFRYLDRGSEPLVEPRVVAEFDISPDEKSVLTEADFLKDGAFDIDWENCASEVTRNGKVTDAVGSVTAIRYRIVFGENGPIGGSTAEGAGATIETYPYLIERRFDADWAAPRCEGVIGGGGLAPAGVVYTAHPTFVWTMPDESEWAKRYGSSYTAFKIRIFEKNGTDPIYDSGIVRAPAQDAEGRFVWTAPISVGDQTPQGKIFRNSAAYDWDVVMYNAKFQPGGETSDCLAGGHFSTSVNTQQPQNDAGYSSIGVTVKYTGPAEVLDGCESITTNAVSSYGDATIQPCQGIVRVQAFTTADFSGVPAAETFVADKAALTDVTDILTNACLKGLAAGTYYIRAYIDMNGNFEKDEFESWGYAKEPVTVGPDVIRLPAVSLYIEDADRNGNWYPDAWEYADFEIGNWAHDWDEISGVNAVQLQPDGKIMLAKGVYDQMVGGFAGISTGMSGSKITIFQDNRYAALFLYPYVTGLKSDVKTTFDAIRKAVEKKVVDKTLKITAITLDTAKSQVILAMDAETDYANLVAGNFATRLYDLDAMGIDPESCTVTVQVWKKATLAQEKWELVDTVENVKIGRGEVEVPVSVKDNGADIDPTSGFYMIKVVQ